jgi:hypothetical protein
MKRFNIHIVLLILLAVLFISCLDILGFGPKEEKWMTFTVLYETDSTRTARIALADYDDLENYRFITDPEDEAGTSFISPDKKKIIILTKCGIIHNSYINLYDIEADSLTSIYKPDILSDNKLYGTIPIIWDRDSQGFYYWIGSSWGTIVRHYDLNSGDITDAPGIVHEVKGDDSLYIFSSDGNSNFGYYSISRNGGEQHIVKNPYLHRVTKDDRVVQNAYGIEWNEKTKEFLFVFSDTTSDASRITITDYYGNRKTEYTSSYSDHDPVWGPDNKIIFFERYGDDHRNIGTHVLNIKTKGIIKLSELVPIEDASMIWQASY